MFIKDCLRMVGTTIQEDKGAKFTDVKKAYAFYARTVHELFDNIINLDEFKKLERLGLLKEKVDEFALETNVDVKELHQMIKRLDTFVNDPDDESAIISVIEDFGKATKDIVNKSECEYSQTMVGAQYFGDMEGEGESNSGDGDSGINGSKNKNKNKKKNVVDSGSDSDSDFGELDKHYQHAIEGKVDTPAATQNSNGGVSYRGKGQFYGKGVPYGGKGTAHSAPDSDSDSGSSSGGEEEEEGELRPTGKDIRNMVRSLNL